MYGIPSSESARITIDPYIIQTPVEYSPWLSEELGCKIWFKMENLQITGSFKLRGAAKKILSLDQETMKKGVIAASTGNHGAAVAYISRKLEIPCTVFVPKNVSPTKVGLMELFGAELEYYGEDSIETEHHAREESLREKKAFISPYNDLEIISGQGTIAIELAKQIPDLDAVFVPVGGGGMISGIANYLKEKSPSIQVYGCQPLNSPVMYESIKKGKVIDMPSLPTLSDGTAGGLEEDSLTFPICRDLVDEWVMISEEEIRQALRFLIEKHYLLVEGAAGLGIASLRKIAPTLRGKNIAIVLCGRKLGLKTLREIIQ